MQSVYLGRSICFKVVAIRACRLFDLVFICLISVFPIASIQVGFRLPMKILSVSTAKKSCHEIMATSDEVKTIRLTVGFFCADFKIPTVPLIAG
jgi:hypothetical protein